MTIVGTSEFDDLSHLLGISVGRLYRPLIAHAGDYVFAMTDENQAEIDVATSAPVGRIEVYQQVDVTTLAAIFIWIKWKPSPDTTWRLQVSVAGTDIFDEEIDDAVTDPSERDWFKVTAVVSKLTGVVPVAVTLRPV